MAKTVLISLADIKHWYHDYQEAYYLLSFISNFIIKSRLFDQSLWFFSFPELLHSTWATSCGQPPQVDRGFYNAPDDDTGGNNSQGDGYPVGSELQASCISTYTLNCTHPHRHFCGRISCQADGRWVPKDGNLMTGCVPKPAVLTVNGDDGKFLLWMFAWCFAMLYNKCPVNHSKGYTKHE